MNERNELARTLWDHDMSTDTTPEWREMAWNDMSDGEDYERAEYEMRADAILAAGYRKPRIITTAEELDALPVGSVVHSEKYIHHANGMQISFQRWDDGLWHRGARSSDTHPSNFLPATVLWEPK